MLIKFGLIRSKIRKLKHRFYQFYRVLYFLSIVHRTRPLSQDKLGVSPQIQLDSVSFHWQALTVWGQEIGAASLSSSRLCLGVSRQRAKERSQTVLFSFFLSASTREKGKSVPGCVKAFLSSRSPAYPGRKGISFGAASSYPASSPHPPYLPPSPPFIGHIISECKQRLRVFNCAAACL